MKNKTMIIAGLILLSLSGCSYGQERSTDIINIDNTKVKVLAAWADIRLLEDNVLFKYEDLEVKCYMSEPGGLFCFDKKENDNDN